MINDKNLKASKMQERNKLLFVRQKIQTKNNVRHWLSIDTQLSDSKNKIFSAVNFNEAFSISDFNLQWINLIIFSHRNEIRQVVSAKLGGSELKRAALYMLSALAISTISLHIQTNVKAIKVDINPWKLVFVLDLKVCSIVEYFTNIVLPWCSRIFSQFYSNII